MKIITEAEVFKIYKRLLKQAEDTFTPEFNEKYPKAIS